MKTCDNTPEDHVETSELPSTVKLLTKETVADYLGVTPTRRGQSDGRAAHFPI